ncbi:hypothetical protein ABKN59_010392 [Abortiporus biennis]
MPSAPVDNSGDFLHYEDSGPPSGVETYKTLVIIHGTFYNGGIFQHLLPHAETHSLRIVRLNQRDYAGSSLYTPNDISLLESGPESQLQFLKDRGKEYAAFLKWFIESEHIPLFEDGKGGIAVMSWSSGNCFTVPFFGLANEWYDQDTKDLLGKYLCTFIIFDSPYYPFGLPLPKIEDIWSPMVDTSLSPAEKAAKFPAWNASYYTHATEILSSITATDLSDMCSREEFIQGMTKEPDTEPTYTSSRIPPEVTKAISNPEAVPRANQKFMVGIDRHVYHAGLEKLIFEKSHVWPKVKIEVAVNGKSTGYCVGAAWELKRWMLERSTNSSLDNLAREVNFRVLKDYNHYPHWDYPEELMKIIGDIA